MVGRRGFAPLAVAVVLVGPAGCASVQDMAGIRRAGYISDGRYVLNEDEAKMPCRQIRERLDALDAQLKAYPQKAALEQQDKPSTLGSAFGRLFGGPGDGLQATDEYKRATAESDVLNTLYMNKKCF
jgi:hypothetical protein